jgi:lactoylglutathione lyase
MDATIADLAAKGLAAEPPSSPDGSQDFWTCWITDPDGYRLEMAQWPVGHADGMSESDFSRLATASSDSATPGQRLNTPA